MKRSEIPVEKVTLNLFAGDAERLRDAYPRQGASFIIRNLVRQLLRKIDEDTAQKTQPFVLDVDLKGME